MQIFSEAVLVLHSKKVNYNYIFSWQIHLNFNISWTKCSSYKIVYGHLAHTIWIEVDEKMIQILSFVLKKLHLDNGVLMCYYFNGGFCFT